MTTSTTTRSLFIALLTLALLLIGLLLLSYSTKNNTLGTGSDKQSAGSTNPGSTATATVLPRPVEPSVITSRVGRLLRVNDTTLVFGAQVYNEKAGTYEETELVATLSTDTLYYQVDRTAALGPPRQGQQPSTKNVIALGKEHLSNGDRVQVFAKQNIKELRRFPATQVWRIIE